MLSQRSYFFDRGLHFGCQRCGTCCTGAPGTIYVGSDEIGPIADQLNISNGQCITKYLFPYKDSFSIREDAQGRCLFFEDECAIYSVRPFQCRSFPFWFDNVRSELRWAKIQRQCPGIGKGRWYSKEEIMALARRTTLL